MREIGDPGAPNLVLAGHAGDVGTGTPDPTTFDNRGAPSRSRHIPCQQFAALAAAKNHNLKSFQFRHDFLLARFFRPKRPTSERSGGTLVMSGPPLLPARPSCHLNVQHPFPESPL